MKNIIRFAMLLFFVIFMNGCLSKETGVNFISDINESVQSQDTRADNIKPTDTINEKPNIDSAQVTIVEWKAVFEEPGDCFHLYITINGKTDYYAGYYWPGVNFENSYVSDAPKDALATLSTMWTQEGQWFYIYQKNDDELAVMNHPVVYPEWLQLSMKEQIGVEEYIKKYEEYQEILIIPIEKGSQIQVDESVVIQKPPIGSVG